MVSFSSSHHGPSKEVPRNKKFLLSTPHRETLLRLSVQRSRCSWFPPTFVFFLHDTPFPFLSMFFTKRLLNRAYAHMPYWKVLDHKIPCQHIREYPHALVDEHDHELQLAIKQYIPNDGQDPAARNGCTIIGAPGNSVLKVGPLRSVYISPVFSDLISSNKRNLTNLSLRRRSNA